MVEFDEDYKKELIDIIEQANTGNTDLSNRQAAILFHWVSHINDEEYAWVPNKYKEVMPGYLGGQK